MARTFLNIATALCIVTAGQNIVTAADNPELPKLRAVITIMIHLLENGYSEEMVLRYSEPEKVDQFIKKGELPEIVKRFSESRSGELKEYLKKALTITPEIREKGAEAVFKDDSFPRILKFRKIAGRWYLMN